MEGLLKQSTAVNVTVTIISSTDHIAGKTGLSAGLTIYATKAAGTPAAITPTITELDSVNTPGLYKLALTATHTNTLGELQLHITGTGADPTDIKWQVVADLPGASVSSVTGAVASVTGNVGGNVTGSVGSISGVTFPTNFASTAISATGIVSGDMKAINGTTVLGNGSTTPWGP